jgi:hypothetical protein
MEVARSRIGIQFPSGIVRSLRVDRDAFRIVERIEEGEAVREWFEQQEQVQEDTSMIGYFYRCMEEGSDLYYVYHEAIGWRCGGVVGDTPLRGGLFSLEVAREVMEQWEEDLKYGAHERSTSHHV